MIRKCSEGHWYDDTVNRSCPHCKLESEKLSFNLNEAEEDDKTISIAQADLSLGEELGALIGSSLGGLSEDDPFADLGDLGGVNEDGDKTIGFGFFGVTKVLPVAGWLICLTGEERGKDFRLVSGKNFVGRSTSMDVVLIDDKTISREKHCSVTYDPKGNAFYVSPENANMVYVNDAVVETAWKLSEGDQITIGNTTLVFVPYCKDRKSVV